MEDVFAYIDKHSDLYLERLIHLCQQPTIAIRRQGITEGAQRLAGLLEEIGAKPQVIPFNDTSYVITRLAGESEKTLGFYNHFDTHPPEPLDAWESPPFDPVVRGECLFGRGASDNKGNVVARICAIEAIKKVRGRLPVNVAFFHDGEEEIGSPNISAFLDQNGDLISDVSGWIWEGGFKDANDQLEVYLGFNGLLYVELEVKTSTEDTHGSHAGIVPNAAWRLIWALSTIKRVDEKILVPGIYDTVVPPGEDELALLQILPFDTNSTKKQFHIKKLAGSGSLSEALVRQYLNPYINISGIKAGYQGDGVAVILPHSAVAKLEIYLVPKQDPDEVIGKIRAHLDAHGYEDVRIRAYVKMPPSRTRPSAGLAQAVVGLVHELYGHPAVLYPIMPGASPMGYFTGRFGVPGVSTGVGYINSRIHQPNENVRIKDFIQGIKLIASLIERMGQPGQAWS